MAEMIIVLCAWIGDRFIIGDFVSSFGSDRIGIIAYIGERKPFNFVRSSYFRTPKINLKV